MHRYKKWHPIWVSAVKENTPLIVIKFAAKILLIAGAGLLGFAPVFASDAVSRSSSLYVEAQDFELLYAGQLPPGSATVTNPFEAGLQNALDAYTAEWGSLPTFKVSSGASLARGASGGRVEFLRQRLGLPVGSDFDDAMAQRVRQFRAAHGLPDGEQIDASMIAALNRGPHHLIAILKRNLKHASDLPDFLGHRFVYVDLTTQRLMMVEGGKVVDSMAVMTGKADTQTPAMAGLLRHAILNPYWTVPPDLVRKTYARRVLNGGAGYLRRTGFEALQGYGDEARVVPSSQVDWSAVERGEIEMRLRQKPGPGNGMGDVKFMFPNALGIYLHDTPSKHLFKKSPRLFSAGCVRVERPMDLGQWLFNGRMPAASGSPEERVRLPFPMPIYITHFTVVPEMGNDGLRLTFRDDVYGFDRSEFTNLTY